jgi:membrane-associated phospholipid phosphatase
MNYAIELERALGGGRIYPAIFQDLVQGIVIAPVLDRFLVVVHSSHFLAFLFFGLAVWLLRPDGFNRYKLAMLTLMYVGALFYLLIPTVPPWMAASRFGVIPPIEHISAAIYNTGVPSLVTGFDTNPIAAMPSLHAAFPTLCCFIAAHHFHKRAWPIFLYGLLVLTAIVYLGEHYLVDVIAGILLSVAVYGFIYNCLSARANNTSGLARIERWLQRPASPEPRSLSRVLAVPLTIVFVSFLVGAVTVKIGRPFETIPDFVSR